MTHALTCASKFPEGICDCPAQDYRRAQAWAADVVGRGRREWDEPSATDIASPRPSERELIARLLEAHQKYTDAQLDLVTLILTSEGRR